MYFKKLELIGFKSFPEKTELNFEPGITTIVGPNGCGKTNISDAIRWVLGEQSAKSLRGQKMEDIIFSGTEVHKPLGFAEVSLTLNNEDKIVPIEYSEVTVTRRCYRSGESEYFINKNPCRLRDVHELFMDTGIGTESYSVMEQGKVDLILSSKPEDRRFVLEEAAGIAKYHSRREAALRKIELTNQNLLRIEDIIAEVKREIISLKRQVTKAQRYKEDYEILKKLEINLSLKEYKAIKESLTPLNESMARHKEEEVRLKVVLASEESEEESLHLKVIDVEKAMAGARDRFLAAAEKINSLESRGATLEERGCQLKSRMASAGEELKVIKEKIIEAQKKIEVKAAEGNKLLEQIKIAGDGFEGRERQLALHLKAVEDGEKELEENKNSLLERLRIITNLDNEREKIKINSAGLDRHLVKIRQAKEKFLKKKAELSTVVQEGQGVVSQKRLFLSQSMDKAGLQAATIQNLRQEVFKAKKELEAYGHKNSSLDSRLRLLNEWHLAHQGYGYSLAAILREMERASSRQAYGLTPELIRIETELTFSSKSEEIKRLSEEREQLLARMAVLEKKINSDDRGIERLEKEREELLALCRQEEVSLEGQKSFSELKEAELKRLEEESDIDLLEGKDLDGEKRRLQEALIQKQEMSSSLEQEKNSLEAVINQKADELQGLKIKLEEERREKEKTTLSLTSFRERKDGLALHLGALRENLAEYNRNQARLDEEIVKAKIEEENIKAAVESLKQEKEEGSRERIFFKEEMDRLEEERKKASAVFHEEEARLRKERSLTSQRVEELHRLELTRTEVEGKLANIKDHLMSLYQVDLDKVEGEELVSKALPSKVQEGLSFLDNEEEVKAEIANLRQRLEGLGPVNLMALEENKELEERFALLKREREDIIKARDELHQVITRINQTSTRMFSETLTKVREEFHQMFRLLFNGGKADLMLQEGDVLESGLEIVARPPGKNLSNISQLSGGEKALTAIALLFALFKIRPSPFCVLDEIDAPLDESNLDRFGSLLKEFLKTTQFIIITHNKKTISLAQVIYGITMQEPGISRIVSVKFSSSHQPAPDLTPVSVSN